MHTRHFLARRFSSTVVVIYHPSGWINWDLVASSTTGVLHRSMAQKDLHSVNLLAKGQPRAALFGMGTVYVSFSKNMCDGCHR